MKPNDSVDQVAYSAAISRRKAIPAIGAVVVAGLALPHSAVAQTEATPVASQEPLGEATMPDWRFSVVTYQNPYTGTLTKPEVVPDGIIAVACEVTLANNSPQPLEFPVADVRLRDIDGIEYRGGTYLGTEPRLVSQNLPEGERTRGWVWFGIPETTEPASIVFIAPTPVLRIRLDE